MTTRDPGIDAIPKGPEGLNFYREDSVLRAYLSRHLGERLKTYEPMLDEMGRAAGGKLATLSALADKNPPVLKGYDPRGERIDEVVYHPAYREMEALAYGSGLVALSYDPKPAPRLASFALGYVFSQGESGLYCPVCMTDGVARVLARFADPAMRDRWVPLLASRSIKEVHTGAMFLTERQGGSDVGANATVAKRDGSGWRLHGDKWFCSNADADLILALARPEGAGAGTRGLGMFLVPRELEDGTRNRLLLHRLKDKLGTRSMPTGEITLDGALGWAVGDVSQGFHYMTEMLNLSRLYNSVAAVSAIRRAFLDASMQARGRSAFGRTIERWPLVQEDLADLAMEQEAALTIVFEAVRRFDRVDADPGLEEDRRILRILTPLIKLLTGKIAVASASEAIELLGGNGYIEDWPTARLLRDAQVLPIWEGTTNILSLDVQRTILKEGAHEALFSDVDRCLEDPPKALAEWTAPVVDGVKALKRGLEEMAALGRDEGQRHARRWALRLGRVYQAALLVESAGYAARNGSRRGIAVASRFIRRHLLPPPPTGVPEGASGEAENVRTILAGAMAPRA